MFKFRFLGFRVSNAWRVVLGALSSLPFTQHHATKPSAQGCPLLGNYIVKPVGVPSYLVQCSGGAWRLLAVVPSAWHLVLRPCLPDR